MYEVALSIIIPMYNAEKTITRCLDSIFINNYSQDFNVPSENLEINNVQGFEIVVVDDMSSDFSRDIVRQYQEKYQNYPINLHMVDSKKLPGGARNVGISLAKGRYIGFVDSDDWVDSNMFKELLNTAVAENSSVAVCGVIREYDIQDGVVRYQYSQMKSISGDEAIVYLSKSAGCSNAISSICCNKIFCSEMLKKNNLRFIENRMHEDDYFTFVAFLNAEIVTFVPDVFYHYYQRPGSLSHSRKHKHYDDLTYVFTEIKRKLVTMNRYLEVEKSYNDFRDKSIGFIKERTS